MVYWLEMVTDLVSRSLIGTYGILRRRIPQTGGKTFIYDQSWCGSESIGEVNTRRNDMTHGSHVMCDGTTHCTLPQDGTEVNDDNR